MCRYPLETKHSASRGPEAGEWSLSKSACFGLEHRICGEDGLVEKKKNRLNVWRPESLALF